MNAPYDPALKEALARIEQICFEYGIGGYVSLVSQTHGEFRPILPAWAGCTWEYKDDDHLVVTGVRLKVKKEERDKAEMTAHFIHSGLDCSAHAFQFFDFLVKQTKEKWKTEHESFKDFRPHREEH